MAKYPTPQTDSAAARLLDLEPEPLSEQRWSKIEQGVFARLDSDAEVPSLQAARPLHRHYAVLVAAAATLCLVVVALVAFGPLSHAESADGPSRISTGAAPSHLALPGLSLDVSPESTIVVSGSERESTLIVVDRGEVACDVAHRRPGAPLIVQAGEVRVEVVGTRFRVTRQGEGARVAVLEGVVRVSSRGQTVAVRAGEAWPELKPPPAPAPEVLAPSALPTEESAQRPRGLRFSAARPTPVEPSLEPPPQAEPSVEQQSFELATRLERSDSRQAIQLYRDLEGGGSSWAKNALFAHGRLEAARGNRVEARRILTQYLTRFPQGGNAQDARMLLGRLE